MVTSSQTRQPFSFTMTGDKPLISKFNRFPKVILKKQFKAGNKLSLKVQKTSREIIRIKKAPGASGNLEKKIKVTGQFKKNAVIHKITANTPYAGKMNTGFPEQTINVTQSLLRWVEGTLGANVARRIEARGTMTIGRPSGKRKYNAQHGMRYFEDSFQRILKTTPKVYEKVINNARSEVRI